MALDGAAGTFLMSIESNSPMYLSLNRTLVSGRVPWPEFARLAARVGFKGVDVPLEAAMKQGYDSNRKLFQE